MRPKDDTSEAFSVVPGPEKGLDSKEILSLIHSLGVFEHP